MLGKTHKAFGVASLAATGIAYHAVTTKDITHIFIPDINDMTTSIPFSDLLSFANNDFSRLWIAFMMIVGALAGASYPDIDQNLPIKHRGITHTLWFVIGLVILYIWVDSNKPLGIMVTQQLVLPILMGTIIGYMSHLIADAFSTSGIAWFYPLQGYRPYAGGAEVVKGNRFIFQPIYKVGQKFFGIPGSVICALIAILLTIIWLLGI